MKPVTKKTETKRPVKIEGYNSTVLHQKRDARRRDADTRQVVYDALSVEEKINIAARRRGESRRELSRLHAAKC